MKTIFLNLLLLTITFVSCSKENNNETGENEIIGKWKLIQTYADPGDGSGNWMSVTENESYLLIFYANNTFERNGSLNDCSGTYSIVNTVLTLNCNNVESTYSYSIANKNLIIDGSPFYCDESCAEKFERIIDQ